MPPGQLGDAIRYGEKVAAQTAAMIKANVGAGLVCTSCHINGARTPNASPWVGLWGVYPAYDARSGRVITLADRINECLRRSMNGEPLPLDSVAMRGLLSFIWWLSKDVPTGEPLVGPGSWRSRLPAWPIPPGGRFSTRRNARPAMGARGRE